MVLSAHENSKLNILYTNVDVLTQQNKLELDHTLRTSKYHIITLTEVKPKHYHFQPKIEDYIIEGYNIECRNIMESTGRSRGMLLYIYTPITLLHYV